jgi:prevent-host-death family protein
MHAWIATIATESSTRGQQYERLDMTRTIAHRELRNSSSAILREVQAGESFTITNHGEVVAMLVPPTTDVAPPVRVRRAIKKGGFSQMTRIQLDHPIQDDLDYLRGDR